MRLILTYINQPHIHLTSVSLCLFLGLAHGKCRIKLLRLLGVLLYHCSQHRHVARPPFHLTFWNSVAIQAASCISGVSFLYGLMGVDAMYHAYKMENKVWNSFLLAYWFKSTYIQAAGRRVAHGG